MLCRKALKTDAQIGVGKGKSGRFACFVPPPGGRFFEFLPKTAARRRFSRAGFPPGFPPNNYQFAAICIFIPKNAILFDRIQQKIGVDPSNISKNDMNQRDLPATFWLTAQFSASFSRIHPATPNNGNIWDFFVKKNRSAAK